MPALVRAVPDSFTGALVAAVPAPAIDVAAARRQHEEYRRRLEEAGHRVDVLGADEAHPDCPFLEDTAVLVDGAALLTRPGAPERRGEVGPVADALAATFPLTRMEPPATLDGGDVLELGRTLFVGRSRRTNEAGIAALARLAARQRYEVVAVDVGRALHLKSVVNRLDDGTVLLAPGHVAPGALRGVRVVETAPGEEAAANVLAVGEGTVLVPAGYPATADRISAAGFDPVPVEVGEFTKADGGLTCLSLRW